MQTTMKGMKRNVTAPESAWRSARKARVKIAPVKSVTAKTVETVEKVARNLSQARDC